MWYVLYCICDHAALLEVICILQNRGKKWPSSLKDGTLSSFGEYYDIGREGDGILIYIHYFNVGDYRQAFFKQGNKVTFLF